LKERLLTGITNTVVGAAGFYRNGILLSKILGRIKPRAVVSRNGHSYTFFTPNHITHYRAETLFTKEPATIDWMDTFEEGEIFYDIGANVGNYSIYAAKSRNVKVFAFEPTSTNYFLLNQNILLNSLDENVTAFCVGLSDSNSFDYVYMPGMELGGALVNVGSNLDYNKKEFKAEFKQGILAFRLDDFIKTYKLPQPNHVKIDVDGLENQIINGSLTTLKNSSIKSLLIEINESLETDINMIKTIESTGLRFVSKSPASIVHREEFQHLYNYIFRKN
jgi:FkbM family methyltransferase